MTRTQPHIESTDQPSSVRRAAGAFSIVELLVSIAVVAILIAILLPSLSSARYRARTVRCLAAKHSVGQGFQNYLADHDGYYPDYRKGYLIMAPHDIEWYMLDDLHTGYGVPPELFTCTMASKTQKKAIVDGLAAKKAADPNRVHNPKWILGTTSYWVERGYKSGSAWASREHAGRHILNADSETHSSDDAILTDVLKIDGGGHSSVHSDYRTVREITALFGDGRAQIIPVSETQPRYNWWHPPFAW